VYFQQVQPRPSQTSAFLHSQFQSPTGMCKGWHGLSKEEFESKLKEYKENAG